MMSHATAKAALLKRLRSFDFLRGLEDAALARLADGAAWKVFSPNSIIFWEGDLGAF